MHSECNYTCSMYELGSLAYENEDSIGDAIKEVYETYYDSFPRDRKERPPTIFYNCTSSRTVELLKNMGWVAMYSYHTPHNTNAVVTHMVYGAITLVAKPEDVTPIPLPVLAPKEPPAKKRKTPTAIDEMTDIKIGEF